MYESFTAYLTSIYGVGGRYRFEGTFVELYPGTAEGEGLVGPRSHHFFASPPPLFALKRKIIKIKKRLETSFFPSIFCYILCIFFNFNRQAFCGTPVLFAVIVPWGRLAP